MPEFFKTTAGHAVIGVVLALAAILIIELNYRLFFKYLLDFIFGVVAIIVCSPVLIAGAVVSYKRAGRAVEKKAYLGAKGKIVYLREFVGFNGGIKNLPRLLDIVCGKLSFVGTLALPASDGALLDDFAMKRFLTRPGLFNHLALTVDDGLTFEKMFERDAAYCKKRELFTDIFIVLKCFALAVRGEGENYLGEARNASYAQTLVARGTISSEQAAEAAELALKAEDEETLRKNFKKEKYGN